MLIRYIPVSLSLVAAAVSCVLYAAPINTPVLATMDNFRDIAGTTTVYTTSRDGTLRTGVFYRSNALALSSADQATLSTLGISDVYDLRTASEIASSPTTTKPRPKRAQRTARRCSSPAVLRISQLAPIKA